MSLYLENMRTNYSSWMQVSPRGHSIFSWKTSLETGLLYLISLKPVAKLLRFWYEAGSADTYHMIMDPDPDPLFCLLLLVHLTLDRNQGFS